MSCLTARCPRLHWGSQNWFVFESMNHWASQHISHVHCLHGENDWWTWWCEEAAGRRRRPALGRRAQALPPGVRDKAKLMTTHSELQLMIRFLGRIQYTAAISTNSSGCFRFVCMSHRFCASLQPYTNSLPAAGFFLSCSCHHCVNLCKWAINSTSTCCWKPAKDLSWNFKPLNEQNLPQRTKTLHPPQNSWKRSKTSFFATVVPGCANTF